tara:strand:+ start:552 stop:836 length:285 start_codon:yes stop_codon:yes gene_type:complete
MKLTTAQLRKLIKQSLKESYDDFGADDPTERMPKMQAMNKEQFIRSQILDWVHEFEAVDQGEMEIIAEILKDAYDEIGHALEMDNTGLYENKEK